MKYSHTVKYNGRYYRPGEDVPEETMQTAGAEDIGSPRIPVEKEVEDGKRYTKTEINQMKTAELQELAAENGVKQAHDMTGSELKSLLIEMLVK